MKRDLFVSKTGSDSNSGERSNPFFSISKAARIAQPGDAVIVREGTYREWVSPRYGGLSDQQRITYRAAAGEHVIIKGSEVIPSWERDQGSVWKSIVSNKLFGDSNPYQELLFGDWFFDQGRDHHTGEVYLNGKSLFEVESLEKVRNPEPWKPALDQDGSLYTWYCEQDDGDTIIYANFHEYDPNGELVEINVRPACFYPRNTGINYITVAGFEMCQAATPWAPPSAEQVGLIGPHWAKGWIIEDNHIHDAKCSGVSLGKEHASGENEWSRLKVKHGAQREREVIFRALQLGWSKETIGSHVVRNNTIHDCGQTGICGHLGAVFSTISGNHIYNIHPKDQFTGHEMAGIKIHAAIDTLISKNHIHHCTQGIWMDWQAQGLRMTGNLLYENRWNDIHIEVSHGPYVVDNNLFLSPLSIKNISQGGTYAHNLIGGRIEARSVPNRFTPYHFPHSTQVAGVMTILAGDDRFYNNIFAPIDPERESVRQKIKFPDENREHLRQAPTTKPWHKTSLGLSAYDEFPLSTDEWNLGQNVDTYSVQRLPVRIGCNLYLKDAEPFAAETGQVCSPDQSPEIRIEHEDGKVMLHMVMDESVRSVQCPQITTEFLGTAFESETPFETPDAGPLVIDTDYSGASRPASPSVGPFEGLAVGPQSIVVWASGPGE
jgi:alpha-L-arabinofuranosidase